MLAIRKRLEKMAALANSIRLVGVTVMRSKRTQRWMARRRLSEERCGTHQPWLAAEYGTAGCRDAKQ